MSIPSIDPYPMPAAAELPADTASHRLDPVRAALLIHDMQEDALRPFPPGRSPVTELVHNASRLRRRCAELGVPVSYTARPAGLDGPDRGSGTAFGGPRRADRPQPYGIGEPLAPAPHDRVFPLWRYSAFHATDLAEHLAGEGRDQLIVCGVYAHVGVLVTACDALSRDLEVFLVADAVADLSATHHRLALAMAAQRSAVTVSTDTVLGWLAARGAGAAPAGRRIAQPEPVAGRVGGAGRGRAGRHAGRRQEELPV